MGCHLSVKLFRNSPEETNISKSMMNVTTLKAVLLIQNHFRRYRAKCEARRQMTWKIHQMIEYSKEQNQILMQKLVSITLNQKEISRVQDSRENFVYEFGDSEMLDEINWDKIDAMDAQYKGLKIEYPITTTVVKKLLDFLQKSNNKLSNRDILQLVLYTQVLLRSQTNLHEILTESITICGDIHGNFDDLVTIFQKNCLPSTSNPYIFNGDFVDRGPKSIEVIAVLFACLLQNPRAIYLNRGNHEDYFMNGRYGFFKEIKCKYQDISEILVKLFTQTFALLPLGALVNNSVLVVHGGISVDTDLSVIRCLRRDKFSSVLHFESDNMDVREINEWKQILNLLWSDPRPVNGCKMNTYRGGGCYFGPDITSQFLSRNQLKLLVRSHECKMNGWDYCHDNKVLTVFSASNYYELGSNFGAFITIDQTGNVTMNQYRSQDAVDFKYRFGHNLFNL